MAEGQTPPDAGTPPDGGDAGAAPPRPDHVPEKFWNEAEGTVNTEAWGKSYKALEQKQSAAPAAPPTLAIEPPTPASDTVNNGEEFWERVGLDPRAIGDRFREKGKLTAAQYKALNEKNHIPEDMMDMVLGALTKNHANMVESRLRTAHELFGGEKQYAVVAEWARANLSPEELESYSTDADGLNEVKAKQQFEWLNGKYAAAVGAGKAAPLITGEGTQADSTGGYATQDDFMKATMDPRYESGMPADKAYTDSVLARLQKTPPHIIHGTAAPA